MPGRLPPSTLSVLYKNIYIYIYIFKLVILIIITIIIIAIIIITIIIGTRPGSSRRSPRSSSAYTPGLHHKIPA